MLGNELQSLHQTEFSHFNHGEKKSQSVVGGRSYSDLATIGKRVERHDAISGIA